MGERRIINGAIYEKADDGTISLVGPAPVEVAAPTAVPLPINPVTAARQAQEDARKAEDQQMQRDAAARAERAAERADKTANRQAAASERAAAAVDKPSEFQSKSAGFLGRMLQAESDFGAVPAEDRGGRGLARQTFHNIAPGLENTFVNSEGRQKADQAVENFIAASLRQESGASISPAEFDRQYKIFFPAPGDSEEVLTQKANARRQAIDGFRIAAGPLADAAAGTATQRADNELPDPTTGADLKPQPADGSPPENGVSTFVAQGDQRTVFDERASGMINSLMNAGASKSMIDAALGKQGFKPISFKQYQAAKDWMKANPGRAYDGGNVSRTEDLTMFQKLAASPLGTGAARFANSATAGMVGALGGEKTRGALDAMAAANPGAALAGDLSGGILGALGLEAGAVGALGGRGAAWLGPRLADAGFGGLSGFNAAQDGEGASGALKGAGAGLLGGMLGHTAGNVAGAAFRGIQNPAVRLLRERGVPLTVGQAAGDSGRIGAGIRNVENALTSVPGVNGVVNARYREGLDGFNQAAFRELPGHSGQTGGPGTVEAGELVNDAYSFLDGTNLPIDAPFAGSQAAVRADLPGLPAFGPQVGAGMEAIDASANRMGGVLPGREWQSAVRNTRADRSSIAGQPFARPAVGVMNDVEDNLMGLAQRQGPAGTTESLDAANMLNGSYQTLLRALDNGPAQQADELFTPSRLDAASRQGANAFGGRASSIAGDRPFYDLTTAGRAVLPSTVPDSGTATRGLVAGGVLSAGGLAGGGALGALGGDAQSGAGYGLGTALLLAAGGSRAGQRVLTSALLDRPDLAVTVGNALQRNANRLGWTGAGVLTPLAVGQ